MYTYNKIQDRVKLKGILTFKELGLVVIFLAIGIVLGAIINNFVPVPKGYFLAVIILDIIWFSVLKMADRNGHPTFLFSFISYHLMQPKKLTISQPFNFKRRHVQS